MSKAAGTPAKRALPSKEASLFKELLTLYETRQLKKGQKTADLILKKFPEHGGEINSAIAEDLNEPRPPVETLCMKGLVLTHMGKRDEGIELVKKGMRFDLTSHICWHVFGLIQKGEKNYEEALKSYTQALRFDKVCYCQGTRGKLTT
jgi:tetratricopeptide (TPR) repeat protein